MFISMLLDISFEAELWIPFQIVAVISNLGDPFSDDRSGSTQLEVDEKARLTGKIRLLNLELFFTCHYFCIRYREFKKRFFSQPIKLINI